MSDSEEIVSPRVDLGIPYIVNLIEPPGFPNADFLSPTLQTMTAAGALLEERMTFEGILTWQTFSAWSSPSEKTFDTCRKLGLLLAEIQQSRSQNYANGQIQDA